MFVCFEFLFLLQVIHDGLNCKQYQDQMNSDCDSNAEARRTKDMLAEMIEKGDAMNCPICQVKNQNYFCPNVIMKPKNQNFALVR